MTRRGLIALLNDTNQKSMKHFLKLVYRRLFFTHAKNPGHKPLNQLMTHNLHYKLYV